MAVNLICKWENQNEIRQLPVSFMKNYDFLSAEIQTVTLKKLLGVEFYNEIYSNIDSSDEKYRKILDGCEFTDGNFQYKSEGLTVFLAHLIAAEFQIRGKFNETASGLIIKTDQDYQQISIGAQKQLRNEMTEYAMTYWKEIHRYIILNSNDYPNFMQVGIRSLNRNRSNNDEIIRIG